MMKIFISDAVVSRGYDGAPAIRLFNSENGGEFAVFQVGIRKYDSRAENNHRWVNLKVKAFGDLCERIKKMSLKEGSFISLCGDYDEERWIPARGVLRRSSCLMTSSSPTPAGRRRNRTATARIREARASRATPRRPELPRPHLRLRRSPARPCRHPRKCPRTSRGMRASAGDRTPSSRAEELETTMTTGVKERT